MLRLIAVTLLSSAALAVLPAAAQEKEVLPAGIVPLHYDLLISPDARALTFTGKVAITIDVAAAASDITLNGAGLDIDRAAIEKGTAAKVSSDEKLGRLTLHFDKKVAAGRHVLTLAYHGRIGQATLGFFAMDYDGPDGPRRTLATNFEPSEARKLLPCWDEPGLKASFTVSVDAPKDRMALSNMPAASVEQLSPAVQRVHFAKSPKMSTYLLFLGIGDYERIHKSVDGIDVGVVVKRGDTAKGEYALEEAGRILHYYNDYFGVPFPLPKLDLIAAPGEIEGGSMENWGAIFYSQQHLLFDPKASTEADRKLVFQVVAHEMAHQWFGDLVTMQWWDDLWLNEGFARWMQSYAADDLHPDWRVGLRALSIFEDGKQLDALPSTHKVVQPILTTEQASQAFDAITYNKGAAIITMINAYVGRDNFKDGVRRYMKAHAFGNTIDSDLWSVMQETAGKPILEIEQDLTRQEGVPLLKVDPAKDGVTLTEGRFAADPDTIASAAPQSWRLPIPVATIGGQAKSVLVKEPVAVGAPPPVLVNQGQTGYARVLYPSSMIDGLAAKMTALAPADQLGLLYDSLALGFAGYAPIIDDLKLIEAMPADADPIVWQTVLAQLARIDRHYEGGPARDAFRRFALGALHPLSQRLGTAARPGEDGNAQTVRGLLMVLQGKFGDAGTIAWARKVWTDQGGIPAERRVALKIVAAQADAATFDQLLAKARATKDPLEKKHLFEALAEVQSPELARRMGEIAMGSDVPAGSGPSLIADLAEDHPDLMWDLVIARFDAADPPFEKQTRWSIAARLAGLSAQQSRIAAAEDYEARSVPDSARRPFAGAIGSIRQNRKIAGSMLPEIDRWLAQQKQ